MIATTCRNVAYFDNAATSWPKPPQVAEAMARFLNESACSPGRALHCMAGQATQLVNDTRSAVAGVIGAEDESRVILTSGATDALNIAIKGVINARLIAHKSTKPHVVFTVLEHNAISRPINELTQLGLIDSAVVGCDEEGFVDVDAMLDATNERTVLVCCTHASNAIGSIQPVAEIGARLRSERPGALFCVDGAQTTGALAVDVDALNADLFAFTGHKSLLGPTGVGGLFVGERAYDPDSESPGMLPLRQGGTAGDSVSPVTPRQLPMYFEAGTPNTLGMAGLLAAIENAPARALEHEREMVRRLTEHLRGLPGVRLVGPSDINKRTASVSFVVDGRSCPDIAGLLDERYNIAVRTGLHCAPNAHRAMGTFPDGTVRLSPGAYTTVEELDRVLAALSDLLAG
ncbi:MAG: aminotransferase class V-fold PLP-dependent enzyme [Phycisphaerales bacterium]|nr:aminotransferase class V-fold PLP-dependent enzyme [Phycisphaerales bacterium]